MTLHNTSGNIDRRTSGTLPDGRNVNVFVLSNGHGMQVSISTYGGIVTALSVPDAHGKIDDVVLGFSSLDGYLAGHPYFGAIIGRYCNRIGNGSFTLDDQVYELAKNDGNNTLHGGLTGFDKVLWQAHPLSSSVGPQLQLRSVSVDGDEGFPGEVKASVTYTLSRDNELRLDYHASTDKPTHINLTSHSYFNLAGHRNGDILDHQLILKADHFTPVNSSLIPTGEMRSVDGTPMDFRKPHTIGARIDTDDEQLQFGGGYDHNWVLNRADARLSFAARVFEPTTGRVMEVFTTEPGVQFYTGNSLDGSLHGKNNAVYARRSAFCLETQHFPDSPNRPEFPPTALRPGDTYSSTTFYRFSAE
ncbi:MAG: galactose mutarotase [bacterium]|nr:galactose mutarotase [bacterium]